MDSVKKLFLLILPCLAAFSVGCKTLDRIVPAYPDADTVTYGVGDRWDVEITENVTYTIEILDITKKNMTFKIENKNPEVIGYTSEDLISKVKNKDFTVTGYAFAIGATNMIDNLFIDDERRFAEALDFDHPGAYFDGQREAYYYWIPYFDGEVTIRIEYYEGWANRFYKFNVKKAYPIPASIDLHTNYKYLVGDAYFQCEARAVQLEFYYAS